MLCVIFRSASTPKKGYRLNRSRDSLLRDTGFILGSTLAPGVGGGAPASTMVEAQAAYAYSPTDGRIAQISNPQISNQTFSYAYTPNSNLLATVTGPIHTVINEWEPTRDVLDTKTNKLAITVISKYDYAVNAIGQRTGVATSGPPTQPSQAGSGATTPLAKSLLQTAASPPATAVTNTTPSATAKKVRIVSHSQ